ncbi:MAG: GNAT family N-acetyltransferase [Clostridia bacterium]|nr:GNAT family N-acetyltransferase [Clostridia bacterium]
MIQLVKYNNSYEAVIIDYIIEFFSFHLLLNEKGGMPENKQAKENLALWTSEEHELYIISENNLPIGFLHIWYKGGNVAWIEDVFVAEKYRGKGAGGIAISQAEQIIKEKGGYTAVCIDVVPRNLAAIGLYQKLGYDILSLITVRKELGENSRTETADFLGYKFRI